MNITTEAIVLHLQKHSDKTSLLHLYTLADGRTTCLVYGKSKSFYSIFQPLSIIEIEAVQKNNSPMQIRRAALSYVPTLMNVDIARRSIALFISEIIFRTIQHPLADEKTFNYLKNLILQLDSASDISNLHLKFMIDLTSYLGITPDIFSGNLYLDMHTSEQCPVKPNHDDFFLPHQVTLLQNIYEQSTYPISRTDRQQLLERLCQYYSLHLPDFGQPKSLQILTEIFN